MTEGLATVFVVDDDENVLRALRRLLTVAGYHVSCHSSAEDFLAGHDEARPGCAIVDLGLPGLDGLDLQAALSSDASVRPVIFLTGCGDIPSSVRAMKAGAVDFLVKPADAEALLASVAQALEKDRQARQRNHDRKAVEERLSYLTPREREVMAQVVAGRLNKQIAAALGTVEKTVKVHRGRMMGKMQVRTLADLVRLVSGQSG